MSAEFIENGNGVYEERDGKKYYTANSYVQYKYTKGEVSSGIIDTYGTQTYEEKYYFFVRQSPIEAVYTLEVYEKVAPTTEGGSYTVGDMLAYFELNRFQADEGGLICEVEPDGDEEFNIYIEKDDEIIYTYKIYNNIIYEIKSKTWKTPDRYCIYYNKNDGSYNILCINEGGLFSDEECYFTYKYLNGESGTIVDRTLGNYSSKVLNKYMTNFSYLKNSKQYKVESCLRTATKDIRYSVFEAQEPYPIEEEKSVTISEEEYKALSAEEKKKYSLKLKPENDTDVQGILENLQKLQPVLSTLQPVMQIAQPVAPALEMIQQVQAPINTIKAAPEKVESLCSAIPLGLGDAVLAPLKEIISMVFSIATVALQIYTKGPVYFKQISETVSKIDTEKTKKEITTLKKDFKEKEAKLEEKLKEKQKEGKKEEDIEKMKENDKKKMDIESPTQKDTIVDSKKSVTDSSWESVKKKAKTVDIPPEMMQTVKDAEKFYTTAENMNSTIENVKITETLFKKSMDSCLKLLKDATMDLTPDYEAMVNAVKEQPTAGGLKITDDVVGDITNNIGEIQSFKVDTMKKEYCSIVEGDNAPVVLKPEKQVLDADVQTAKIIKG